jgi:hypothetical protein
MLINVDFEKDIDATQQPVFISSVEVFGIIAMNEDKEDKEEEAGEEDVTDSTEVLAKGLLEVTMNNEVETTPLLKDAPSILKANKKKSMLEVATGSTTEGINPFFAPGSSHKKEGIPLEDFKNIVYLKPTITVPPKPKNFLCTALKWALLQFTEWFEQSRKDLGEMVTLVLLSYVRSCLSELALGHQETPQRHSKQYQETHFQLPPQQSGIFERKELPVVHQDPSRH